jgi:hypothetical protein
MAVRYHGLPHAGYAQVVEWTFAPENQKLHESFLARATVWDDFLRWCRMDIRDYATGFAFHAALSLLALGCVVSILRRDLGIQDPVVIVLAVAALAYADDRMLPCAYASPIMALAGTPAAVAHALSFAVILLILRGRYYGAALMLTLACAFNPRGIYVLYPVLAGGVLMDARRAWPALLIPGIWGAVQYAGLGGISIAEIIQRDGPESHIPSIAVWRLLAFMLVFPLFAGLNEDNPDRFRRVGALVGITSLGVFYGGWIYQAWIYPHVSLPAVWLLSPVRGMGILVLFAHLSLARWVYERIPAVRREIVLGVLALAYLAGVGYPWAWAAAGLAAVAPATPMAVAAVCVGLLAVQMARMERGPREYPAAVWERAHAWGQTQSEEP